MRWIIVGLGNPGIAYARHRHSVGFYVIEKLRSYLGFPPLKTRETMRVSEGKVGEHSLMLCCPIKYMNLSGPAVLPLARLYKEAYWLVIHDELDLPCGQMRFKKGGGTGGHNGLKSLHSFIGSDYARLRIGIGRPLHKDAVSNYVLSPFSKAEERVIEDAVDHFLDLFHYLLSEQENLFVQNLSLIK